MNKKLILAGLVVSSFCLSHFSSCSDDNEDDVQQQQVPTDSTIQFTDTVTVSGEIGNYSYVDLGLKSGLKWATYNVGATKVTDYGDYFTWASTTANELEDKYCSKISSGTGSHSWGYQVMLTKYNSTDSTYYTEPMFGRYYSSYIDNLSVLELADDAAAVNWGSSWRMPTKAEMDELIDGCTWQWVENYGGTGVSGQIGTSKANGNTIFLQAAGSYEWSGAHYGTYSEITYKSSVGEEGNYWTSSTYVPNSKYASICLFDNNSIKVTYTERVYGYNYITAYSVRAVSE